MKRSKKTQKVVLLLCMCLVLCLLAGCGKKKSSGGFGGLVGHKSTESEKEFPWGKKTEETTREPKTTSTDNTTQETTTTEDITEPPATVNGRIENAAYVMIYNPKIFDEYNENTISLTSLNTGDISSQIQTGIKRAEGLQPDLPAMVSPKQVDFRGDAEPKKGNRAGGTDPAYSKGDVHEFFVCDENLQYRLKRSFTCIYEGDHCYLWDVDGSVSSGDAKTLGKAFDEDIYDKDVEAFGTGRFTENGGKVNILLYPMTDRIGGFQTASDIFATGEFSKEDADTYGLNLDHAIININSKWVSYDMAFVKSTLAHEFQHQICATDSMNRYAYFIRTWLNEAMSAYAEEMVYPGIKYEEGYDQCYFESEENCKGESLYNFDNELGSYGAVYLFEKYITENNSGDVFKKIHTTWRASTDEMPSEAALLYDSVSASFRDEISDKYQYPSSIDGAVGSAKDVWMSKMTLDFNLYCLKHKISENESQLHEAMLYSEINPVSIEGGGRIIVELKNGSLDIPDDADSGLVYIGLDRDYNPVTGIVTK